MISRVCSLCQKSLCFCHLVSLDFQLFLLNSENSSSSTWVNHPHTVTWTLSQGRNLEQLKGWLTLVVSHLSGVTVFHCLMNNFLKIIVFKMFFFSMWENKSDPYYFTLARGRNFPLPRYLNWKIIKTSQAHLC